LGDKGNLVDVNHSRVLSHEILCKYVPRQFFEVPAFDGFQKPERNLQLLGNLC
jgi:hypothetical protein